MTGSACRSVRSGWRAAGLSGRHRPRVRSRSRRRNWPICSITHLDALLLMVIFRKVEPLDGAGLQLAKRHQGRRLVGEEMAAGDRIALDADDAPVDAAAHPVGGHAEMGGDFRHAEPARYLRPACPLRRKLEAMLQADSLHGAREYGGAAR